MPVLLPAARVEVTGQLRTKLKFIERDVDHLVSARVDGIETVLHIELQVRHDDDLPLRMRGRRFAHLLQSFLRSKVMEDSPTFQFILDRGRAEGRAEGLAQAILAIAERRLGTVPEGLADRLAHLDPEQLDLILRRALDAKDAAALRTLLHGRKRR